MGFQFPQGRRGRVAGRSDSSCGDGLLGVVGEIASGGDLFASGEGGCHGFSSECTLDIDRGF